MAGKSNHRQPAAHAAAGTDSKSEDLEQFRLRPDGEALRTKLWAELSARAPWCITLDTTERRCLLTLMRKMLRTKAGR